VGGVVAGFGFTDPSAPATHVTVFTSAARCAKVAASLPGPVFRLENVLLVLDPNVSAARRDQLLAALASLRAPAASS
jgi:hypothetical protein